MYDPPAGTVLGVGTHTLTVTFTPADTATYDGGTASVDITVTAPVADPGTLTATPNPATPQSSVVLSATFGNATSTAGLPTGSVTFKDGATTLGTAALQPVAENFVAATAQTIDPSDFSSNTATVTDFNRDGIPDALVVESGSYLYLVPGADHYGNLMAPTSLSLPFYCDQTLLVTTADFNNDGYPDIAVVCPYNPYGDSAYVFLNYGDGTFDANNPTRIDLPTISSSIAAADVNKDGNVDLVLSGQIGSGSTIGLTVLVGSGDGNFTVGKQTVSTAAAGTQLSAVDLNNDGYADVVVGNSGSVAVFKNDGTSALARRRCTARRFPGTTTFYTAAPKASAYPNLIVISTGTTQQIAVVQNSKTAALNFSATPTSTSVPNLQTAAVGDFTGDGNPDVATYDGTTIKVYNGSATGTYSTPAASFTGLAATNVQLSSAADANGDGYADLLAVHPPISDETPASLQFYVTSGTAAATLPGTTFSSATHTLTATAPATATYATATANTTLVVATPTPAIALMVTPASPTTYSPTGTETLTATLTTTQAPFASGTVNFFDGTTQIGTGTLTSTSTTTSRAVATVGPLVVGTHSLSARYVGDANYAAVASTANQLRGGEGNAGGDVCAQPGDSGVRHGAFRRATGRDGGDWRKPGCGNVHV